MGKYYKGTWSTNNGNTWSNTVYTAKTRIGLLRILGKIIDGNLTGYNDKGRALIYAPHDNDLMTTLGYDNLPDETLTRTWSKGWVSDYPSYSRCY